MRRRDKTRKDTKKKEKTYVCTVCGKKKNATRKVTCCGEDMLSKDKGSWNM